MPRRSARCWTGKPGAYRDAVLMNAAAALVVAGRVAELRDGVEIAAESIDTGCGETRGRDAGARHLGGLRGHQAMATILDKIKAYKLEEIAAAKAALPLRRWRRTRATRPACGPSRARCRRRSGQATA
jgi:hypothetical protein